MAGIGVKSRKNILMISICNVVWQSKNEQSTFQEVTCGTIPHRQSIEQAGDRV